VGGTDGQGAGSEGSRGPGWQPPFEFLESKLHPPRPGHGIVPRTALLERLLTVPSARLVCLAAPSGYGKTTLLAQWAERRQGRRAWVTLDRHDNDPVVLLRYLAVALDRVDPVDPELLRFLESPGAATPASLISRFVAGLSSLRHPLTVVLDDLELLVNQECLDAVAEVGLRLPAGSRMGLAARARPSLPSALTHPSGQMVEVGPQELAMDEGEVRAVLERAGVRLSDAESGNWMLTISRPMSCSGTNPSGARWKVS